VRRGCKTGSCRRLLRNTTHVLAGTSGAFRGAELAAQPRLQALQVGQPCEVVLVVLAQFGPGVVSVRIRIVEDGLQRVGGGVAQRGGWRAVEQMYLPQPWVGDEIPLFFLGYHAMNRLSGKRTSQGLLLADEAVYVQDDFTMLSAAPPPPAPFACAGNARQSFALSAYTA